MDISDGALLTDQQIGLLRDNLIESIIHNFSGDIVRCVDLQKLVPHLSQQHLLTKVEEAYLADEREDHSVRIRRHLIPLLMKEGRVSLAGFCTALVSSSMEHPGHVVLAQNLKQEVVELAKQDTEVFLERNYLEKAAAIDEYCPCNDLFDQSQAVALHLCKRLKKHITGQLTGGHLQTFAVNIGMSIDIGMKIMEDYLPNQHYDMVVSHFMQGKSEATPMRIVVALARGKGLGRLLCHVSDLWGTAHGAFTDLLSKLLIYDWPTLARHLGYTEREINKILDSHEDTSAQVTEFLSMWRVPDCGPHTLDAICWSLWGAKLDSVAESFCREGAFLVDDLNYGVILAHRAERSERRRLVPLPEDSKAQSCSMPTTRLAIPAVAAWQVPQWQTKLRQWPTRPLEAVQEVPAKVVKLHPPPYTGHVPSIVTDVRELNADGDEHTIAQACETEALSQDGGDPQYGLKAKTSPNDLLVHLDEQHPKPVALFGYSSCASEEGDNEAPTSSSQMVQGSSRPAEETYSRQGSQSSESAQCPSPAFTNSEATGKPVSCALPSPATAVADKSKQCSSIEQPLVISSPFDGLPVPVISDTPKETPVRTHELSDDNDSRPGNEQPLTTEPLDMLVRHGNSLHSSFATNQEQDSNDVNPLWQFAMGGLPDNSQTVSVAEVKDTDTNELTILSTADADDQRHLATSVTRPAAVSKCGHADAEPLYEACVVQFNSEFVLRNSVEFPRFVSDAEHHLVFSTAASPQVKEKTSSPNELLRAICAEEADLNFIITLVDTSTLADLAAEDKDGATALYHAATRGLHDVVKALIHKGVDIDCAVTNDAFGRTPLLSACASERVDVVGLLLEHGANPNKTDLLGRSCLLLTAVLKNVRALYQLLDHGASVNVRAHTYNTTPLALACLSGQVTAAHILLDKGADPCGFPASETGLSPLAAAVVVCNKELVETLLNKGAFVDPLTPAHYTPLHIACFLREIELVQLLIARGAGINSKALTCETPLMAAVSAGAADVVKYLLNHTADVNISRLIQNEALTVEVSPLGEAALSGQESVFESLMEFDPDVNFAYKGVVSVLCLACVGGNVNIVDYLLKTNDIDLSVGMSLELTLVLAMSRGNRACAELILEHVELDKIVSHGKKNSRKQLLEALQPFQACVAPNGEGRAASQVEVMDISAAPSVAQVSNDLSDTTETDKAQRDFDQQSLTEMLSTTPEPEHAAWTSSPSVHPPRQATTEESILGRNERAAPHERKVENSEIQTRLGRSEPDEQELLRQLPQMFDFRRDQLNVLQQTAEQRRRLASLIRFLIIAAGDTGDLLTDALDNNFQHICQFLTEYSDGTFDTDSDLLDRLKDVDGEPSTLVFVVRRSFNIDSLVHLAQGMDYQLGLHHFRKLKDIMEKERRSGLSLHEILGITGQSRLVDIALTSEQSNVTRAATAQVVTPNDRSHMKPQHPPPTAGVRDTTATATAHHVTPSDESHMKTQHPPPTAGVHEATAAATAYHVTPNGESHVKTDHLSPTAEVPADTATATNQAVTLNEKAMQLPPTAESEVLQQSQNDLNPDGPAMNSLDVEEVSPPEPGNAINALDMEEGSAPELSNVVVIKNDLLLVQPVQSAIDSDANVSQVVRGQLPNVVAHPDQLAAAAFPQTVCSESPNMSSDIRTEGRASPNNLAESFSSVQSDVTDGQVVSVSPDVSVPPEPVTINLPDDSQSKAAVPSVLSDHCDTSPDVRMECSTPPSTNVKHLDSAYKPDSETMVPQSVAAECDVVVDDMEVDTSQSQQGSIYHHTSPNVPKPEPSSLPEAYYAGSATDRQTVHQNETYVNSVHPDSGNSEFDSKTHISSKQPRGSNCQACSCTEEVRIDTQIDSHKQLLTIVARKVGNCWTMLARRLGVSEEIISEIKGQSFTPQERCSALLKKWTGESSVVAGCLWSDLQLALCQVDHCSLVRTIAEHISEGSADDISQQQDSMEEPNIDITDVKHLQSLTDVSEKMGSSWRLFCDSEGLGLGSCDAISDTDMAFSLLIQWVKRKRKPTFQNLVVALRKSNLGYISRSCYLNSNTNQ